MALARTLGVALVGVQGHVVDVEADIAQGLPAFVLVGLPDASLMEARDRVRAATANSGCTLPPRRITVNLSPATLPKRGSGFDLAVAVAVLAAAGTVPPAAVSGVVHLGELGLDGSVRAVRGVLPAVLAAARAGCERVVVPHDNADEAALVPGVRVLPVRRLADLVAEHRGDPPPEPADESAPRAAGNDHAAPGRVVADLSEVVGQAEGRLALEVAAAGGHHLLLTGPPGVGKTMLAARLPGLLPDLAEADALEVTAVHSVAGTLPAAATLVHRPPFEDPHHTASVAAVIGGGSGLPRPGAASRAHRGVLFLDEAPEFDRRVLESLRQPLEHGELVLHRSRGTARFPARFQLVLAANPCPCGRAGGKGLDCTCTPDARRRYAARLSGPLLDRVDLRVAVRPVTRAQVGGAAGEPTAVVAARVAAARAAAAARLAGTGSTANGQLRGAELRGRLRLAPAVTADLDRALDRGALTVRGYDRVLRVAWTLADLAGRSAPHGDDLGRALALRGAEGGVR
ncbi:magnesium chelatase family protein [Kineococcus xinjiangensis]|uniref:Magnesium chelatase family protein n=1 Tax=Kineococcus xinjiangensis TaxID=512762 RepID=A0A2S6IWA4_9ACTN|nr:YifB family Mg chelatase-like AAA ATPase [Kineococcus xinjiangensis]PPK98520.1 magnesium chelatase family protein [Kineococcus xinjiangensis]